MIAAYGPYAASATGGNDLARDFLAGVAALYSTPCKLFPPPLYISFSCPPSNLFKVYENIGATTKYTLEYPSTILACLSIAVIIPIYVFYFKGEWFRERSKFAKELNAGRQGAVDRRRSSMPMKGGSRGNAGHVEKV